MQAAKQREKKHQQSEKNNIHEIHQRSIERVRYHWHVCSQCVCAACVQRLHCALDWTCKDCGIWFGSSIFLRFLAMGPGLDWSGTRSECENALTHRNEFLLLAVKEFWYWESYLSGFAAANFFESPQKSGIEDLLDAWILHCSAVLEPSEIVGMVSGSAGSGDWWICRTCYRFST